MSSVDVTAASFDGRFPTINDAMSVLGALPGLGFVARAAGYGCREDEDEARGDSAYGYEGWGACASQVYRSRVGWLVQARDTQGWFLMLIDDYDADGDAPTEDKFWLSVSRVRACVPSGSAESRVPWARRGPEP